MTKMDEQIAQAVFQQLRHEAANLNFTDLLILKSGLSGHITFPEMPDKLREGFARVALAAGRAAATTP